MLRLKNIRKVFNEGTVNEKVALDGVTLTVEDGEFATIVGSNGAGKSTLFNCIGGSFFADEGSIYLDDRNITYVPEHKRAVEIGRLFQDPMKGTAPHMTIEENLSLAYLRAGQKKSIFSRPSNADREMFRERLALLHMGLEDRMKQPVGLLSGGQRQALTLLMATLVPPKILLLDEHTAALDPATADKVLELTKKIVQENNLACLMITHNMHSALELGNRTLMMDSGRIVLDIKGEERDGGRTAGEVQRRCRKRAGQRPDSVFEGGINKREETHSNRASRGKIPDGSDWLQGICSGLQKLCVLLAITRDIFQRHIGWINAADQLTDTGRGKRPVLVYLKNMQEGLGGQLGRICFRDERMLPVILHIVAA